MKRFVQTAAAHLKRSRRIGAFEIVTWVAGANAADSLGQHFYQIAAGAISDCIGSQILQSVPPLARMSGYGFDSSTIATQVAAALVGGTLLSIFPGIRCPGEQNHPGVRGFLRKVWKSGIEFHKLDIASPEPLPIGPSTVIGDNVVFSRTT